MASEFLHAASVASGNAFPPRQSLPNPRVLR
jgi:hypothetical protein